jgi:hypothetical protein
MSSGPDPPAETTVQDQAEGPALQDPTITAEAPQTIVEEGRNDNLKLENAGEGAQPLRLLACGHVFHVSLTSLLQIGCAHSSFPENMFGSLANGCFGAVSSLPESCRVARGEETSEGTSTKLILC